MNSSIPFNRHSSQKQNRANKKGLGLRLKMVFLFVVIPIILVALSGLIHLKQMNTLSSMIIRESSNMLDKISGDIIADKAGSVATQGF